MMETNMTMTILFVVLIVAITITIVLAAVFMCRAASPPPPPPRFQRNGQLVRRPSENKEREKERFAQGGGESLRIPKLCFGESCIDKATVDKGISTYMGAVGEMNSRMKTLRGKLDDNTAEYEKITETIENINKNRASHISELKRRLDKATERRLSSVSEFESTVDRMKADQEEAAEDIDELIAVRP